MSYNSFGVHRTGQGTTLLPKLRTPTCPLCDQQYETRSPLQIACAQCKKGKSSKTLRKLIDEKRAAAPTD